MTENHPCTSPWMKGPWHDSPITRKSSKAEIASHFFRKTTQEVQKNNPRRIFANLYFWQRGSGRGQLFPQFSAYSLFYLFFFFSTSSCEIEEKEKGVDREGWQRR